MQEPGRLQIAPGALSLQLLTQHLLETFISHFIATRINSCVTNKTSLDGSLTFQLSEPLRKTRRGISREVGHIVESSIRGGITGP